MTTEDVFNFLSGFHAVQSVVHETAKEKGWWRARDALIALARQGTPEFQQQAKAILDGSIIALMHSELSEGLEGVRNGGQDDKIPQFTPLEAEYADTIVRIMDHAEHDGLRVAEALLSKIAFNKTREPMHGGKLF